MPNFVTTSLPDYVKQNNDLLLKNFALVGGTRSRISIQTGIKESAYLNYMEVDPTFQDGKGCGYNSAGSVSLTQRIIKTAVIKINLDICPETLRGKYAEHLIKTNASEESLPFEQYVVEGITNTIGKRIDKLMWQGDTTKTEDSNLKWIDGFLKILDAEDEVINVSIATESIYDAIEKVYMELPDEVVERGAEIYLSPANYRKYMTDLVKKNFYHYAGAEQAAPTEFFFPGTAALVVSTYGLTKANNDIVGTFPANLYYGCDMEGDEEVISIKWSEDDDVFKLKVKWNSGVQVAFPNMVVRGKIS